MITDPTKLFEELACCLDEESGRPTNLPTATTNAIAALLEDDLPEETEEVRGMNALAAQRLRDLDLLVDTLRRILYWNGITEDGLPIFKRVIHGPNVSMLGREYIEICNLLEKLP